MNNSEIEDTLAKLDDWAKTSRSKGRTLEQAAILIRRLRNEISREEQERDDKEPCEYCKSGEYRQDGTRYMNDLYRFCPACGRRLRGEDDD